MEQDVRQRIAEIARAVLTANGRVSTAERRALARLDALGLGSISTLCEAEPLAVGDQSVEWQQACAELARLDARDRAAILSALAEIAASDDYVCSREIEAVSRIARLLGLPSRRAVASLNSAITNRAAQRSGSPG